MDTSKLGFNLGILIVHVCNTFGVKYLSIFISKVFVLYLYLYFNSLKSQVFAFVIEILVESVFIKVKILQIK